VIVEPFTFGAYTVRDFRDAGPREQAAIGRAIRDGLFLIPVEYKCGALALAVDGDYTQIRLGVYRGKTLIGAWWLGAHEAAPGHTKTDAKLYTRPCPGMVPGHEVEFWNAPMVLQFVRHLFRNPLRVRGGGTIQFVGFDYALDSRQPADSPVAMLREIDVLASADRDLVVERRKITRSLSDNRWTLCP
jgi:hypothetical protein